MPKIFTFYKVELIRKGVKRPSPIDNMCADCYFYRGERNTFKGKHLCIPKDPFASSNYPCIIGDKDYIFVRKDRNGKR